MKKSATHWGLGLCVVLSVSLIVAQEPDKDNAATTAPSPTESPAVEPVVHTPPPPTAMQKLDGVFANAVDGMALVLFKRLFTTEREYVVYEQVEYYVRDRGTAGPFERHDPAGTYAAEDLDDAAISVRAARNELLDGDVVDGEQQDYRLGMIGDREVEFIAVKIPNLDPPIHHGDKYVLDPTDGLFHRLTAMRELPSPTDTLDQDQVARLTGEGLLQGSDGNTAIQTESVGGIPIVVLWLAIGAVFFTIYMQGFNIWGFRHAVDVVRGKYDDPDDDGEVSHFQALASALSATVGLGNIAGVTIAMTVGGPGAFFWMILCGLFGMTSKFVECTLGQAYRLVKPDGTVLGGPMRYLDAGLTELNLGIIGKVLSIAFAIMCVLASFGGGNMFQANQSRGAIQQMFQKGDLDEVTRLNSEIALAAESNDVSRLEELQQQRAQVSERISGLEELFKPTYGIILAVLVGFVIIGGIKRIGAAAEKVVPTMCLIYVGACLFIILSHIGAVPALVGRIFTEAWSGEAMGGGLLGVLVVGVQRAAFSNEAGVGSAAIAHSAAKTKEPIREGCVALLGPFIDTIVVCSMTALVILITGAWDNSDWVVDQGLAGAALTSRAFQEEIWWFPYLLSVAVALFAYSTIISWSYYGERAWETLFGPRSTFVYKLLCIVAVFIGSVVQLGAVLDFSDMMILCMAFPNIAGVILLSPKVKRDLRSYWQRYRAGEFVTFK